MYNVLCIHGPSADHILPNPTNKTKHRPHVRADRRNDSIALLQSCHLIYLSIHITVKALCLKRN